MVAKKKHTGLGKGLEALFGELDQIDSKAGDIDEIQGVANINIDEIKPNQGQPRKTFNKESLDELSASIKEHGIIQPIIVRPVAKGYEIVAGERRYRASRLAGIKEVPCLVRELSDEENMLFAIIENMQREDLNPLEEAEGIGRMISCFGLTQLEVSKSIGKSRPYITNTLRLLKLPEEVKTMMSSGKLTRGHGRTLLGEESVKRQIELATEVINKGLSVRTLEELVNQKAGTKKPLPRKIRKNPDVIRVEEDLKSVLGTKVSLKQNGKKGKIEIEYYSRDELERLIDILRKK